MRLSHPLMRLPAVTLTACVVLCLGALRGSQGAVHGSAPQTGAPVVQPDEVPLPVAQEPLEAVLDLPLEELHAEPAEWLGARVRFVFQFQSRPAVWDPGLTRFGSSDHLAVLAWSDRQLPWRIEDHDDPRALVFARRGSDAEAIVLAAHTYQRLEAVGRVAQVFLGRPWIELETLEVLPEEINEGAVLHASRALASMERGAWRLALEDLARAGASNLPRHAREELVRLRARCEEAMAAPEWKHANAQR